MNVLNKTFAPPALPLGSAEYSQRFQDELNRVLRLYFNANDSLSNDIVTLLNNGGYFPSLNAGVFNGGGQGIVQPYAMLMSNVDQLSGGITSENLVSYNQVVLTNGVTVNGTNDTEITVPYPGQYLVTFSIQFANRGNTAAEIEIWAKAGGANYPLSNTRFDIDARKSESVYAHTVAAVSGIFTVTNPVTEYLELAWWSSGADVVIEHYAAGTSPTRPEIPGVILTINLISAIPPTP